MMGSLPIDSRLLLGYETSDDAAVWKVSDSLAAVLTVDFFTPIVDDPYDFGCVAAANALSDVFAMGAQPHVALNLLALDAGLGTKLAATILQGGADKVHEAGAFVCGGHTIDDPEPKYGLCVFGSVDPDRIIRNEGARPGDLIYLTKPIGTGIMSAALNIDQIGQDQMRPVIDSMKELNAAGSQAMIAAKVHAATDVTGFGLAGHLHEMLEASNVSAILDFNALPIFKGAWELACAYCRPGKTFAIMDDLEGSIEQGSLDDDTFDNRLGVICDPQTSGGMLVTISPENARIFEEAFEDRTDRRLSPIGQIAKERSGTIRFADA